MKKTSSKIPVAFGLMVILTILSCATQKSKEDISFLGKVYHNTTAKYNGYFNADEIMQASYLELANSNVDNYTEILNIYPYQGGDADKVQSELDRAIEKVSIVAMSHEVSHWRDDCYLLIGEAQMLKKDYESAEETFEYFAQEFDPLKGKKGKSKRQLKSSSAGKSTSKTSSRDREKEIRERKKSKRKGSNKKTREELAKQKAKEEAEKARQEAEEREKEAKIEARDEETESYFMKHRPVYNDGMLWLARTYIENDKFLLAQIHLRRLDETKGLHKEVKAQLYTTLAYYYMEQEQYKKAALELERAYVWEEDKSMKARLAYIMGQLAEKRNDFAGASEYFDRVLSLKPAYELVFNATLRKAINANASGTISAQKFTKEMEAMLKDDKNIEYQDQIYSAMAAVAFDSGDNAGGIALLKNAVSKGDKKSLYKSEAYYQLAEYFFAEDDYINAKAYYDSTLTAMTEDDIRRPRAQLLSNNLADIATQLSSLVLQDSLIALSKLSDEELLERAKALQEDEDEAAELAAIGADNEQLGQAPTTRVAPSGLTGSSFFAYDALLKDKGLRDFKRTWGDRPLEDNWRWSQKGFSSFADEEDEEDEESSVSTADDALIEKWFADVPRNEEDMQLVMRTRENALFTLGKLYRDNMQNCQKSTETLEILLEAYPQTENRMDALFYLYLCAVEEGDMAAKTRYGNLVTKEFPHSLYAKSILDPDFIKKQEEARNELDRYYQETYDMLTLGQYALVEKRLTEVDQLFAQRGELTARFALLNAMMAGQKGGKEAYIDELKEVIARHKETPEATRAREIMRFLEGDEKAFTVIEAGQEVETNFKREDEKLHYVFAVIFDLDDKTMNDVKISISDYNRRFHKNDKLSLSTLDLDIENSTPIVLIRKFKNKEEAMGYYHGVQKRQDKFISSRVDYEFYAISQRNYREVIKERSVDKYRAYFNQFYLEE